MTEKSRNVVDVTHIASLSRLQLTPDETARFQGDVEAVLDYVALLSAVDVVGVEPTAHAISRHNIYRDDSPVESMKREDVLDNAPEVLNDQFIKVPQVITAGAGGDTH